MGVTEQEMRVTEAGMKLDQRSGSFGAAVDNDANRRMLRSFKVEGIIVNLQAAVYEWQVGSGDLACHADREVDAFDPADEPNEEGDYDHQNV
jgi:hypothetical protein